MGPRRRCFWAWQATSAASTSQGSIMYSPLVDVGVLLWPRTCSTKAFDPMLSLNSTYSSSPTTNMVGSDDIGDGLPATWDKAVEQCNDVMLRKWWSGMASGTAAEQGGRRIKYTWRKRALGGFVIVAHGQVGQCRGCKLYQL